MATNGSQFLVLTLLWDPSLESGLVPWLTLINRMWWWCASSGYKPQGLADSTFVLLGSLSFHVSSRVEKEKPWDERERERDALVSQVSPAFQSSPLRHQICEWAIWIFQPSQSSQWLQPHMTSCESEESPSWAQSIWSILRDNKIALLSHWVWCGLVSSNW